VKVGDRTGRRKRKRRAKPGQLPLWKPHGGKRRGAGRKPKRGRRSSAPHRVRGELDARHPVHVVLRVVPAVGSLRRRYTYKAIRQATVTTVLRERFRIVHLSIQRTHLHLIVEANDKRALASGMQGFQISAARHLNAAISRGRPGPRRRGTVFPDRYHAEVITSPTQARHTLAYVLSNWRKHGEDRAQVVRDWKVDYFSSAPLFPDWVEYQPNEYAFWPWPETYEPLMVHRATTWLLRDGWKKAGSISTREVPSARR
jgi:REP-associated tyrosine transposase